ncbi:hypothetical protein [Rhizomicrobium electricum]|jgi:hypothetical protein|uniref:Uncharacterized protein n=1 Tax=Rhizomicrobium electricum TaxID=480070 RepID=A0ABN1EBD4_9PROT|nr:hypothetical protein [Rhizomicrobium electricum]NIJ48143.1 hypothetical protein [Rhizomicrobium electricum]
MDTTGTTADDRCGKTTNRKSWRNPQVTVLADIEDTSKIDDLLEFSESQGPS